MASATPELASHAGFEPVVTKFRNRVEVGVPHRMSGGVGVRYVKAIQEALILSSGSAQRSEEGGSSGLEPPYVQTVRDRRGFLSREERPDVSGIEKGSQCEDVKLATPSNSSVTLIHAGMDSTGGGACWVERHIQLGRHRRTNVHLRGFKGS